MPAISCYYCEAPLAGSPCQGCGAPIDLDLARKLDAAWALDKAIADRAGLDGRVRDKLRTTLRVHLAALQSSIPVRQPPPAEPAPAAPAPVAAPLPQLLPLRPRPRRANALWSRLGPAFAENILLTLAVFLIVGGAIFFVTTAWTTMTGSTRLLVVFGGLQLFGALLFAAGRTLNRGGTLPEVQRTLTVVTGFLAPIAAVVAGLLLLSSWPLGALAAAVALLTTHLVGTAIARQHDADLLPWLPRALLVFAGLGLVAPSLAGALGWMAVGTTAALVATSRAVRSRLATPWVADTLLGFAALVVITGAALHSDGLLRDRLPPVGVVVAALGLVLAQGTRRNDGAPARGAAAARSIAALALGVTGSVLAMAEPRLLLVACALATVTAITAAFTLQRPALLWPGLALSAITYFLLPAPVRELASSVRAWFAGTLGYPPERLPLSFYGITFLPYTAACALAAAHLRHGRPAFASLVLSWTLTVAAALAVLSVIAGNDARAPAAVLGAEGATLAVLGCITQRQRLLFAGVLGVLGSLVSLLVHRQASATETIAWLAGNGLVLVAGAARLQRNTDAGSFRRRASHALLDAAGVAALATTIFALSPSRLAALPNSAVGSYAALAMLVGALAIAYRQAWLGVVAWIVGGVAGLAALGGAPERCSATTALVFAIASALPLLLARFARVRFRLTRPDLLAEQAWTPTFVALTVLALQAFAAPAVVQAWSNGSMSTTIAVACAAAGIVVFCAGGATRLPLLTALGAGQLIASTSAATMVLGYELRGFAGCAGLAAGAGSAALAAWLTQLAARVEATPAWVVAAISGWLAWCAAAVQRLYVGDTWPGPTNAGAFLLTMAGVLATSLLTAIRAPHEHRPIAALQAALGQALVAIAICDVLRAGAPWYPLALIIAGVVVRLAGRRYGAAITAGNLGLALLLAVFIAARDLAGEGLLLLVFALLAVVGRFALGPLPVVRSICVLVGALGTVWFALSTSALALAPQWLPAVVLGFAAAATLAPAVPRLGVEDRGMRCLVLPIAAVALLVGTLHAAVVLIVRATPFPDSAAVSAAAAALAALGLALGWREGRGRWPIAGLALASFVAPPLNGWWTVTGSGAPWPDVEFALLALVVAACKQTATTTHAYALAAVALALTALDLRHPSTPWTFGVATAVPLVLTWRQRRDLHIEIFGYASLATAWVTTLHLRDDGVLEALPMLAAIAGLLAVLALGLEVLGRLAITASLAAVALVATDIIVHAGADADAAQVVAAIAALLMAGAAGIGRAVRSVRSWTIHIAIAAVLTGYAFGALRTPALAAFADHHPHVVLLLCVGFLFAARRARPPFAAPLRHAALAVPIPAIALVGHHPSFAGAFALLLGAIVYGYAALTRRGAWLPWISVSLLNGALFSLWQHHGIVDPAFYGIPAGLTLIVGAELLRQRTARLVLWSIGLITLYGSIAVQVLRTEEPLHALLLFVAGFTAVMVGFARRRNDYILAGTVAVIVDVVSYLARHGLERDFVGAGLLVASGLTVLMAAVTAKRRRLRA